jgi:antitoxin HigA-1
VIVSCRDKRTRAFVHGERVKAFSGFERVARLKLDRLEAATSLRISPRFRVTASRLWPAIAKVSTAFVSMISGESVSSGLTSRPDPKTWRSLTIIRSTTMALNPIHPGEHLAEELHALDMSAAELARKLGVPTNRITQILNGTRAITGDTALRLGHFFGTSAQLWLNLQTLYDLRCAEQKSGKSIKTLPRLKRREPVHA